LGLEDVKKEEKLATIYKNLGELIKAYRKADVRVVLVGFDLPSDVPAVYKTAAYQKKFKQIYKKIAQQYQIPFYPNLFNNLDDIPFYRSVDKYHLNKKGVRYVSEKLYSTVGLLLQ
jgi:lysophospholipase L1-like esterase